MLKRFLQYLVSTSVFGLFLMSGSCQKEAPTLQESLKYEYDDDENSLLWEISGKDLKQPSFLYGTIHIMRKEVFAYDDVVKRIFDTCSAYAMELNMADIDMKKMTEMMMMDKPLDSVISPDKYHQLDSLFLAESGAGLEMFKKMKPFFIMATLMKKDMGDDMGTALDLDFYNKAQEAGKKLIGIEKFEEQMAAVDALTIEEQVDMMLQGFSDTTSSLLRFDDMMKMYLEQDLSGLTDMMLDDPAYPKEFNEAFIVKRNKRMADRISDISQKRMTFNAVGAAHLPGKEGVIALLREKGYTVKPIHFTFQEPKPKKASKNK